MRKPPEGHWRIKGGRPKWVGPPAVVVPIREDGRCALDTCGVFIPYEMTREAGGPGYCTSEHEREGGET